MLLTITTDKLNVRTIADIVCNAKYLAYDTQRPVHVRLFEGDSSMEYNGEFIAIYPKCESVVPNVDTRWFGCSIRERIHYLINANAGKNDFFDAK